MSNISIVFLRHGHADNYKIDSARPLSSQGKIQAQKRAVLLTANPFELIITSSATRAKQTAHTIIETLKISPLVIELDQLYQPQADEDREHVNMLLESHVSSPLSEYINKDKYGAWGRYTNETPVRRFWGT